VKERALLCGELDFKRRAVGALSRCGLRRLHGEWGLSKGGVPEGLAVAALLLVDTAAAWNRYPREPLDALPCRSNTNGVGAARPTS
jgi:hypothetical protein